LVLESPLRVSDQRKIICSKKLSPATAAMLMTVAHKADELTVEISDTGRDATERESKRDNWLPFEVGVGIRSKTSEP
jgi:hypothetical protein